MPATHIVFADYGNHPPPRRIYLDANFAYRLLYHEINQGNPVALRPSDIECHQFYQRLVADSVEIIGSVLTFSEVLHLYCFIFTGGMYDLTEAFLKLNGISLGGTRHSKFKHFLNNFPHDCQAQWAQIKYRVGATEEFFDKYGIKLLSPLPSPRLTNITRNVVNFASILKDYFVAIEAADALHLSMSAYLQSDAVVSLDLGFLTVDGFTVYSPQ